MTQEDKDLLLKDICCRLPYEVILVAQNGKTTYQTDGNTAAELLVEEGWKPYLRPISNMTEEEFKEWLEYSKADYDCEFKPEPSFSADGCHLSVDWLNAHHFDYRGLIEKGLAIEVTADNNPYKE